MRLLRGILRVIDWIMTVAGGAVCAAASMFALCMMLGIDQVTTACLLIVAWACGALLGYRVWRACDRMGDDTNPS
jgi:hypothetical protein